MKILIVDDEPLARGKIREMLKNEPQIERIGEAGSGREALAAIHAQPTDLVFLDIQMPDLNGFQVLEKIAEECTENVPAVIFVTAYEQYALQAFEFQAVDYLLKPFDRQRFAETLHLARDRIRQQTESEYRRRIFELVVEFNRPAEYLEWLTIRKDERIKLLRADTLSSIEAQGNYVLLNFPDGSEMLRETMDNLETHLNPQIFVRIHRSTIVNVNQINELQMWASGEYRVLMRGGKIFTLSRGYRRRFDEFLKKRL